MYTIVTFSFYGALILPPIFFICTMWKLRQLRIVRRLLVSIFCSGAFFASLLILAVSIFFRDGMGPDATVNNDIGWVGVALAFVVGTTLLILGIWVAGRRKTALRLLLIMVSVVLLVFVPFGLFEWRQDVLKEADMLKPNVFPSTYPKWLFNSGYRFDFDAHESLVISNWISTHQTGWEFGSEDDFNPNKTQFLCDNYTIEINSNAIVFQYYKDEYDMTNDPEDSFIIIKRSLSTDEQAFWKKQIAQIRTFDPFGVKSPP
jgi:hypothetical protein